MDNKETIESIKTWADADRPREKMLLKGRSALSDAELIAIIINSGSKKESAVSLSKRLLADVNNNLHELGKVSLNDLMKYKGIGEAKAISIAAAVEIGRRRSISEPQKKRQITTSRDAYNEMSALLDDISHEEMWIVLTNNANKVIHKRRMTSGGSTATVVDIKMILRAAIENNAQGIILYHNHPSGTLKPSREDIHVTEKIKNAAQYLDLKILDHIIIADTGYFSFVDEGLL